MKVSLKPTNRIVPTARRRRGLRRVLELVCLGGLSGLWLLCLPLVAVPAAAQPLDVTGSRQQVLVNGRSQVLVTKSDVLLGDLAEIRSTRLQDDEIIIGLQKIFITKAPAPGRQSEVSAAVVLEQLRSAGVDLNQIGYSLPRSMLVQRAGRAISHAEVTDAIRAALERGGREISLRRVDYRDNVFVLPGVVTLGAKLLETSVAGRMEFALSAEAAGSEPIRFQVGADIDEWREVPVAARPISKGSVIGEDDLKVARMSLRLVPGDAEVERGGIVGLEASRSIGLGEVFQRNKLVIPAVITAGSKVIMRYQTALIEATASGTALEAGIAGQIIKIKNDASRKILTGTVLEPGLVGVGQ